MCQGLQPLNKWHRVFWGGLNGATAPMHAYNSFTVSSRFPTAQIISVVKP